MNQLLLIVTLAGQRVAIQASAVQSVIELDALTPVPRAPEHVAGLSALRSRVLTVIDCARALDLPAASSAVSGHRPAAVVELDGHYYALMVDGVDDVLEGQSTPAAVRAGLEPGWERVSLGLVETELGPLLLVDVAALISGAQIARAA